MSCKDINYRFACSNIKYYILQICIYIIGENDFKFKRQETDDIKIETMTETEYADDLALFLNRQAQTESRLYSIEQVAEVIYNWIQIKYSISVKRKKKIQQFPLQGESF